MHLRLVLPALLAAAHSDVTVNTPLGSITGFHVDYGNDTTQMYYGSGDVFLGIPYVDAPVGNLRFQLPKPLYQFPGRHVDAKKYGPACPQPAGGCMNLPQNEDCLTLNVFTPNANSATKYPVMVWIHGGAYISGCAPKFPYKGAVRNLVSRGVVVVTLQYRLGVPGFFSTNTNDFPANRGLFDQMEALTFVRKYISYFGGNPNQVTLFGQSSGSISVSAHTYSPLSRGLFHQAIQESNGVLTSFDGALGYSTLNQRRANQLCNTTKMDWDSKNYTSLKLCMAKVHPAQWIPLEEDNDLGWPILKDGKFFPDLPRNLQRAEIPTIIGSMRDEWASVWYGMLSGGTPLSAFNKNFINGFLREVGAFWGDNLDEIILVLDAAYAEKADDDDNVTWFRAGADIFTGLMYTQFIFRDAGDRIIKGNKNVYFYQQNYSSKILYNVDMSKELNGYKPVPHSSDIPYVWMPDVLWDNAKQNGILTSDDFELLNFYGASWTNFAKYGKPTLDNSWQPALSRSNIAYFDIDVKSAGGMRMQAGFRQRDDKIFNDVISRIGGVWPPAQIA